MIVVANTVGHCYGLGASSCLTIPRLHSSPFTAGVTGAYVNALGGSLFSFHWGVTGAYVNPLGGSHLGRVHCLRSRV